MLGLSYCNFKVSKTCDLSSGSCQVLSRLEQALILGVNPDGVGLKPGCVLGKKEKPKSRNSVYIVWYYDIILLSSTALNLGGYRISYETGWLPEPDWEPNYIDHQGFLEGTTTPSASIYIHKGRLPRAVLAMTCRGIMYAPLIRIRRNYIHAYPSNRIMTFLYIGP